MSPPLRSRTPPENLLQGENSSQNNNWPTPTPSTLRTAPHALPLPPLRGWENSVRFIPISEAAVKGGALSQHNGWPTPAPFALPPPPLRVREKSERHVHTTEPALVVAGDGALIGHLSSVLSARARLEQQRLSSNTRWADLNRQFSLGCEIFVDLSRDLELCLPAIQKSNLHLSVKLRLQEKVARLGKATQTVENWHSSHKDEEDNLWKLERKLKDKEEVLYRVLQGMGQHSAAEFADTSDTFMPTSMTQSTIMTNSSESGDTDEEQYYRTIGNINLLREKLFNLESRYQIKQRRRPPENVQDAQSGWDRPSEEQAFELYIPERQSIIREYFEHKQELEKLSQICHQKGLRVEPPALPPFLDQVFRDDHDEIINDLSHHHKEADATYFTHQITQWLSDTLQTSSFKSLDVANEPHLNDTTRVLNAQKHQTSHHHQLLLNDELQALSTRRTLHLFRGEVNNSSLTRRYSAPELLYSRDFRWLDLT